jgi:hypothetical protein
MSEAGVELQRTRAEGYPLYSLYQEMERRFKENTSHISPATLERCYSILITMLKKERPLKPYEIMNELFFDPEYVRLSDPKRVLFYNLSLLTEIGMIKTTTGSGPVCYTIVKEFRPKVDTVKMKDPRQVTDPRVKPVIASWNRVALLKGIAQRWSIPSVAHSLVYELSLLLRYNDRLLGESNEEGRRRLVFIEDCITKLIEVYTAYAIIGQLPTGESELFQECEEKLLKFCTRIWWSYGK